MFKNCSLYNSQGQLTVCDAFKMAETIKYNLLVEKSLTYCLTALCKTQTVDEQESLPAVVSDGDPSALN